MPSSCWKISFVMWKRKALAHAKRPPKRRMKLVSPSWPRPYRWLSFSFRSFSLRERSANICSALESFQQQPLCFSMFVSFTLTPALCSMWLRLTDAGHKGSKQRGFYAAMDGVYDHMLRWSLKHRFVMFLIAFAVTASVVLLYPRIGRELVPDDDQGEFNVGLSLPKGTSLQRTVEYTQEIEGLIGNLPDVQT